MENTTLEDATIPDVVTEEMIPRYDHLNHKHYMNSQRKFYNDRRFFKGIDEERPIDIEEMDEEIEKGLERKFRLWCFKTFKKDKTKVRLNSQAPNSP